MDAGILGVLITDAASIADDLTGPDAARASVALDALESEVDIADGFLVNLHGRCRDMDLVIRSRAEGLLAREARRRVQRFEASGNAAPLLAIHLAHRVNDVRKGATAALARVAPRVLEAAKHLGVRPLGRASSENVRSVLPKVAAATGLPLRELASEVHRWSENGLLCLTKYLSGSDFIDAAMPIALDAAGCLSLANLALESVSPKIGDYPAIRRLTLSQNALGGLPSSLANLRDLVLLDLSTNQLDAIPDAVFSLGGLETLSLDFNRIKVVPAAINGLGALRELAMIGRSARWPSNLRGLAHLSTLTLSCKGPLPVALRDVPLRKLLVTGRDLVLDDTIGAISSLRWLDVSMTGLTQIPPVMGALESLESLYAHSNPLIEISDAIVGLSNLRRLTLGQTLLPQSRIDELRARMPWCSVEGGAG